jgi:hypothetical protein
MHPAEPAASTGRTAHTPKFEPLIGTALMPGVRLTPARPAETATAGTAGATLLALIAGVHDPKVIGALVLIIGATPAMISSLITNGGLLGVFGRFLRGNAP